MIDRRIIYRWLAGGLLWLLIFIVVAIAIRSVNIVNKTGHIAARAMTSAQELQITKIRETARAFSVEWGTWSGNTEDYQHRLSTFLQDSVNIPVPAGIQEVISASLESTKKEGDFSRVRVMLHTRRLVPVTSPEAQSLPQVYVPVTRDDLALVGRDTFGGFGGQDKPVPVWQNYLMCIEVPVKILDGKATVTGLPVIVPPAKGTGQLSSSGYTEPASTEFLSFIKQFLDLYYNGGPLTNFLVPGANVQPVTGWKLESVNDIRVDSQHTPTRAFVQVSVSAPGVEHLTQYIYLKIKADRGSFLVKDLSSVK
ncbi:conjugal transfer protein [Desulfoscipio geothermicus]|uniref:Conjugative transposon protein TcpC n=1 Tax=Desulfoscipio geothermicus DSM 3669 TaxID=1121426 RepID=A0A1I6DNM0_9FIRM|nr:conjugal transfer protein [Desulfoscipio geothermicus]SFR07083.1 Conjugative transposon protein TcpC [Desulfoscipio geothermicus DSM 3669]